jgi:preprotein translocase subunit SecD
MVDTDLTTQLQEYFKANPSEVYTATGAIKQPSFLPAGKVATGYYENDEYGIDELKSFVVLDEEIGLDGEHLESATTSTDGITGKPVGNFQLDTTGGDLFYKLTSTNVGKSLAVVMTETSSRSRRSTNRSAPACRSCGFGPEWKPMIWPSC